MKTHPFPKTFNEDKPAAFQNEESNKQTDTRSPDGSALSKLATSVNTSQKLQGARILQEVADARLISGAQKNQPIQRYTVEAGSKISENQRLRTSADKKSAFVSTAQLGAVQAALEAADNAKINLQAAGVIALGEVDYTEVVPVMKETYAAEAIASQLDLYTDAWNEIRGSGDDSSESGEDDSCVEDDALVEPLLPEDGQEAQAAADGAAEDHAEGPDVQAVEPAAMAAVQADPVAEEADAPLAADEQHLQDGEAADDGDGSAVEADDDDLAEAVEEDEPSLSRGMQHFDRFTDDEQQREDAQCSQIRVPLDCRATTEHLQQEVSNAGTPDPAVGSNYNIVLDNHIQGTILSAIKGWNFHYASVIAKDGGDNLSFEVGAEGWVGEVMDQLILKIAKAGETENLAKYAKLLTSTVFGKSFGQFDMYGTQEVNQGFDYITYSKLLRHMLDQIAVQMDTIVHELVAPGNTRNNIDKINQSLGLLENKVRELNEDHPGDPAAVQAGITGFVEGLDLTTPEEFQALQFQAYLIMLQLMQQNQAAAAVPAAADAEPVIEVADADPDAEQVAEPEAQPYANAYKAKTLEILAEAVTAFDQRRAMLNGRGNDFTPVRDLATGLSAAMGVLRGNIAGMDFVPSAVGLADDVLQAEMKTWTQGVYAAVAAELETQKGHIVIP